MKQDKQHRHSPSTDEIIETVNVVSATDYTGLIPNDLQQANAPLAANPAARDILSSGKQSKTIIQ